MNKKLIKIKTKKSNIFTLFGLLVVATLLLSGCVQEPPEQSSDTDQSSNLLEIPPIPDIPEIPEGVSYGWQAVYTPIYSNDFEDSSYPGIQLAYGEGITSEEALDGEASVKLSPGEGIRTDPAVLPLSGDTYYIFEFDYRLLGSGTAGSTLWLNFYPEGSQDENESVVCQDLLANADPVGTYSSGALTPSEPNYYLSIIAATGTTIVIDDLKIIRLDAMPITSPPDKWANLSQLPYPRLGNYQGGHTYHWAEGGGVVPDWPEGELVYKAEELEEDLSFFDIVAGPNVNIQSRDTSFVARLREKNPDIVIIPYTNYIVNSCVYQPPRATIDPDFEFYHNLPQEWVMKDTSGNYVGCTDFRDQFQVNIYDSCPVVNGRTYTEAILDFMANKVMASGVWDGIFIDNCIARVSHYIPNVHDPSLFDYDINGNGQRDETLAEVSELSRDAVLGFLQELRMEVGDNEIIIGNCGWYPELCAAPYLNGFNFEIFLDPWFCVSGPQPNEGAWRCSLDGYFIAQKNTMAPHLNILEACGHPCGDLKPVQNYLEPTAEDFKKNRIGLGTALLGDGFYEYDLFDMRSAPYWFDEYSVNENGVAVEDRQYKGYLGMPLGDAVEMVSPTTTIWEEDFEDGKLPSEIEVDSEVYVNNGTLLFDNPDHTSYRELIKTNTKANSVILSSGKTYVVEFDWKILETLDDCFRAGIAGSEGAVGNYPLPEVIAGESGRVHFPVTLNHGSKFELYFALYSGGGKVAIDDIHITEGGAGPWRRDFENGFVLVNPINKAYTFSAAELAGDLGRTGIKRILGTQDPDINNGQPVTDTLTLQAFDAIILLADSIQAS